MNTGINPPSPGLGGSAASSGPAGSAAGSSDTSGSASGDTGADRRFDRAVHATHEAVDRAAASLDHAAERMREHYERARTLEQEWADTARVCVRDHPIASVAAAALAGWVIGRLSSRH